MGSPGCTLSDSAVRVNGREGQDRVSEKTALQRQIDATDRQIGQLVHELYGLTEEEIRIAERTEGLFAVSGAGQHRYAGSFTRYLFKALEYAGRGLRPIVTYSRDGYLCTGKTRRIDMIASDFEMQQQRSLDAGDGCYGL
jgi:hypothetical protein